MFAGANPYLTFHCSSQGTVLIDLATDDKEFQSVEEEVCKHTFSQLWLLLFFSTTTFPEEGSTFFLMLMMSDSRHLAEETAHTVIVAVAPFLSEQTADISLNE